MLRCGTEDRRAATLFSPVGCGRDRGASASPTRGGDGAPLAESRALVECVTSGNG
jgi:hypothetical protein